MKTEITYRVAYNNPETASLEASIFYCTVNSKENANRIADKLLEDNEDWYIWIEEVKTTTEITIIAS